MSKNLHLWLPSYLRQPAPPPPLAGPVDLLLAVGDHFEPLHGADKPAALERLRSWQREWPALIQPFRDADGIRPRHSFFYPIEQHDHDLMAALTDLVHQCDGEVEVHLHHDGDTATQLRDKLERGKDTLRRYGHLPEQSGQVRYGFIHGDWALDNSNPSGRHCGVSNELGILRETGCYADFTLPSAPDPAQTRTINSLYYATGTPAPKSHDTGRAARVRQPGETPTPDTDLLLVQGPLALNWSRRKFGLLPRVENAALTGANPPTPDRLRLWIRLGIQVLGQPNWLFIKLHTHGGIPENMRTFLGDPMRRFYDHLLSHYNDGITCRTHFVSTREMVNILHAAEDGHTGNPGAYRDYRYRLPRSQP